MPQAFKTVTIVVNQATGDVSVVPDPAHIKFSEGEQVLWHSPQGNVTIKFAGDCPFRDKTFYVPDGGNVSSGLATDKGKVRKDAYKYSIEVKIKGDKETYELDPGVIVDE